MHEGLCSVQGEKQQLYMHSHWTGKGKQKGGGGWAFSPPHPPNDRKANLVLFYFSHLPWLTKALYHLIFTTIFFQAFFVVLMARDNRKWNNILPRFLPKTWLKRRPWRGISVIPQS